MMNKFFFIAVLLMFANCTSMDVKEPNKDLTVYHALELAVNYMDQKELMYRENYKLTVTRDQESWMFWFQFLPLTPGMDVTVSVDPNKKISHLDGM